MATISKSSYNSLKPELRAMLDDAGVLVTEGARGGNMLIAAKLCSTGIGALDASATPEAIAIWASEFNDQMHDAGLNASLQVAWKVRNGNSTYGESFVK